MGREETGVGFPFGRFNRRRKADYRPAPTSATSMDTQEFLTPREDAEVIEERTSWAIEARKALLDEISTFLLRHSLDVTSQNLTLAHAALSGSNLMLSRQIGAKENAGEPITQEWLDQLSCPARAARIQQEQVDRLMTELERSIAKFAETTANAQTATATYRDEFSGHLDRAEEAAGPDSTENVLAISRAMLDTMHRIESSMKDSQAETEELQRRLTAARKEADSDHLTGLPNRRAFEREFEKALAQAREERAPLFLAIADIDHFKRVNDTFGHETGDGLLKAISQILLKCASSSCFVARHGGEEFVMLLHTKTVEEAKEKLELARREVESRKFVSRLQNRPIGEVTFSAGLSDVFASEDPRQALASADEALYFSKQTGRNRITIASAASGHASEEAA